MALTRLLAAVLAASSCTLASAAIVDAGAVTTVVVEAPLYDTRTVATGGCGSAGCVGDLTRVSSVARFHIFSSVFDKMISVHSQQNKIHSLNIGQDAGIW